MAYLTSYVMLKRKCRCTRMSKICQPSPPMRRHRTQKRPLQQNTSKLEEKLDDLVTLLTSQGLPMAIKVPPIRASPESLTSESATLTPTSVDSTVIGQGEHSRNQPLASFRCGIPGFEKDTNISTSTQLTNLLDPLLEPSHKHAELYLGLFRTKFIKTFPFIVLPDTLSAKQLRQDRPLLWIAIMTVASTRSTEQIRLGDALREILPREVFIEGTRNMDVLLAILVYISW